MKCGRPVEENQELCEECGSASHIFREGRGIFPYDEKWKRSLESYKFRGCREYADFYAAAMAYYAKDVLRRWSPQLLVPVPLHWIRERQRGFNQSLLIARRLEKLCGIPVAEGLVKKQRATASQKKLNALRRRKNLRDAFAAAAPLKGQRVLVIDDIYTTGSTIDAMADCLYDAGAGDVFFLVFCTAV